MKARSALFVLLLAAVACVNGQSFKPERKYTVGDKDVYTMKMSASSSIGDIQVSMELSQAVTKVYANGDADIESLQSHTKVNFGGQELEPPTSAKPIASKWDKFGRRIRSDSSERSISFSRFATFLGEKALNVGETSEYDEIDKDNPKVRTKGTVKLLSLESGRANIAISADRYTGTADKPMHVEGTVTLDAASGKLLRFQGKAKDIPAQGQGPAISVADFTLEHKGP